MKKIVRLTENDLTIIVKKVLREQDNSNNKMGEKEVNDKLKRMSKSMTDYLHVIGDKRKSNSARDQVIRMFVEMFGDENKSKVNFNYKGRNMTKTPRQFANMVKLSPQDFNNVKIENFTPSDKSEWEKTKKLNSSTGGYEDIYLPKFGSITVTSDSIKGNKGNKEYQQMTPSERETFATNKRGKIKKQFKKSRREKENQNTTQKSSGEPKSNQQNTTQKTTNNQPLKKVKWKNMDVPSVDGVNFKEAFANAGKIKTQLPVWDVKNKPVFMWKNKPYIYDLK